MKKTIILFIVLALPIMLSAQQASTGASATITISNIHVDLNGETQDPPNECEAVLADGVSTQVTIFEKDGIEYGTFFTYKKGKNRIKLVRKGFVERKGMEMKTGKQRKDMQETRTSIPGSMKGRVSENIVLDKEKLEGLSVSFNYDLIYKQ
jgi:hypothetical protein